MKIRLDLCCSRGHHGSIAIRRHDSRVQGSFSSSVRAGENAKMVKILDVDFVKINPQKERRLPGG